MINTWLTKNFDIKYPIILAPMFLISNEKMLIEASRAGIMGCIPALNFRNPELFKKAIISIKEKINGPFGVNIIVNKSNIHLKSQIEICQEITPDFIITSLGTPEPIINAMIKKKTKIFCDVVDLKYAKKVEKLGADALIAVNSGAGGHAGPLPPSVLIPSLIKNCSIPVISAGGIGTGKGLLSILSLGATGVSIGSPFIASKESPVSNEYKKACVRYEAKDIVMSTKISGTPVTVINTPYVKKIGTKQNTIESFLAKNKQLKKYIKMVTFYKGTKLLEKAALGATYKTVWVAGPSIEFVKKIETIKSIVKRIIKEYEKAYRDFFKLQDIYPKSSKNKGG